MDGSDEEEAYSYYSASVPQTPVPAPAPFVRAPDAVSSLLLEEGGAGQPPPAEGRAVVSFYSAAQAAALVNAQVTEVMAALGAIAAPVSPERALLLLQALGSPQRAIDAFSRSLEAEGSGAPAAAASAGGGGGDAALAARHAAAAAAAAAAANAFATTADAAPPPPPPGAFECAITGEDYASAAEAGARALSCGHYFSDAAWADKLSHVAATFPGSDPADVRCMAPRCHLRVPLAWWLRARALPPQRAALREATVRSVLLKAPGALPCPGAGCEAWCVTGLGAGAGGRGMNVTCPAGHAFCSGCGETSAHQPATCTQVRSWSKPANNEGAMGLWKAEKLSTGERRAWECPGCGALCEKNGGCNHVTHAKAAGGCGHDFCWQCLKPWPCKGSYGCKEEPEGANAAPKDLFGSGGVDAERLFAWAFSRFNLQDTNLVAARTLAREARSAELCAYYEALLAQKSGAFAGAFGEVLEAAASAAVGGFQAAKWTYVTAWSKAPEPAFLRSLFEDSQGLLERACGALRATLGAAQAGFQRKDCTVEFALSLRLQLINEKDQLLSFQRRLMDAIEVGAYDQAEGGGGAGAAGGRSPGRA